MTDPESGVTETPVSKGSLCEEFPVTPKPCPSIPVVLPIEFPGEEEE